MTTRTKAASEDFRDLQLWIIDEWYTHHESKFPYEYGYLMDYLNKWKSSDVSHEHIKIGVTAGFSAKRNFDSDKGRWKYCSKSVWNHHKGTRNFEDVVREEIASDEDTDQP